MRLRRLPAADNAARDGRGYNHCTLYYDLGIYAEGMRKLSLDDPNLWLFARGIHLFAYRFDPIVWLATAFAKLRPPPYGAVGFKALIILLSMVSLFISAANGYLAQRAAVLLAVLTLQRG